MSTATTLFLAVPDPAVSRWAKDLAGAGRPPAGSAVVHVSGALPLSPLAPAQRSGWETGSFHPLRPFPAPLGPEAFHGILIAVDASAPPLLRQLEELARRLGGSPRRVPDAERTRYHAAAVMGSNYVAALASEAAEVLVGAGWSREEAVAALLPLMRGALDGISSQGLAASLTGPIRRGDADTVRAHLQELDSPSRARVYRILGFAALELAREAGLDPEAAVRIHEALTG